ncbi:MULTISPECIES: hypothetical protein [Kamptonema]|uniref:hypothetical protein n=1 Tax=Kamptonema TaxID=1501433 RepID=UPI0001DAC7E4|nr:MULTISPECIES: hypothetical protein [Kamptonema]CBN54930.1 hypothetical protein OSCI_1200002 [Kamptonema sp. PCC 6506]
MGLLPKRKLKSDELEAIFLFQLALHIWKFNGGFAPEFWFGERVKFQGRVGVIAGMQWMISIPVAPELISATVMASLSFQSWQSYASNDSKGFKSYFAPSVSFAISGPRFRYTFLK